MLPVYAFAMDSLITAAVRALAAGDAFGALKHVALRDDAPELALRGIAMTQLGEHPRARTAQAAARSFGSRDHRDRLDGHGVGSRRRPYRRQLAATGAISTLA